jgi:hypothetical protein
MVLIPVRKVTTVARLTRVYNLEVSGDHTYNSFNFCSHNCNRNCDAFSRKDNVTAHRYFKDLGHVFRNHKNNDPDKAVGSVLSTAYNDLMGRIELLIAMDNDKCPAEVEALNNGKDVAYSMGASQAFDVCSHCGKKAETASDHCHHVKNYLGDVLADGTKIYMKNPDPKYFDISVVHKPADRIAYSLRKVASGKVIGGHELADMFGLTSAPQTKQATMQALAEMRKTLPAVGKAVRVGADTKSELKKLSCAYGVDQLLAFLTQNKWMLSPEDFAEIAVGSPDADSAVDDTCGCGLSDITDDHQEIKAFSPPTVVENLPLSRPAFDDLSVSCSMEEAPVRKRALIIIIRPSIKTARPADPTAAQGLAMLYKHYKVAFAHHHRSDPRLFRTVASTF